MFHREHFRHSVSNSLPHFRYFLARWLFVSPNSLYCGNKRLRFEMKKPFRMLAVCTALSLLPWAGARAQTTGVTAKEIVIGSCAALEGPSSFLGRETVRGADIYFQYINDEGGVLGRKLRLVSHDDSYDPTKAPTCWDRLMEEKVFAMGFFVGTPTALKYVPLAESNQVPLVGLFTGAQTLYTPVRHWVINVRASYFDETAEQVDGLWKVLGYHKIAVIYPDDAFGGAVLLGVQTALKEHSAEPVAAASYPRRSEMVDGAIDKVRAANPDAVVVVGPANTVAPILKKAHAKGWKPMFLTVSFEGLKKAGKDLTREDLIQAIESLHDVDVGLGPQLKLNYSAHHHKGFDHVLPTVVRGGRAVPFTDWSMVGQK
jgi:Periplasmic binding protein